MSETNTSADIFNFAGGQLCLDLANTLLDRLSDAPVERLDRYTDLLIWSKQAKILDGAEAARLQALADSQPTSAATWLASARQARELIYQIFSAIAAGQPAQTEVIQQFNQLLAQTMAHVCLVPGADSFSWSWATDRDRLERPLWSIVRSAADLLTSPEVNCVRSCASENCGWLFLDTSKNHSRRWCDMKSCGNRAKARRHHDRKKDAGSA